jgi:transaldolase
MTDWRPLNVKIFADGADLDRMEELSRHPLVRGFTTNPTLMRKSGVTEYEKFAKAVLAEIDGLPVSFEVFSDEFDEMERQAHRIAAWGPNISVKIPVTNTAGESTTDLIRRLSGAHIAINVTAVMTLGQVRDVSDALRESASAIVSVFAGRVADTGRDPIPLMAAALEILRPLPNVELLWASPREVLNVVQADQIGCDIITVTYDLLTKVESLGRDPEEFSLDTVKMFRDDAQRAGLRL